MLPEDYSRHHDEMMERLSDDMNVHLRPKSDPMRRVGFEFQCTRPDACK
jgi:hypothetical protein